MRGRVPTCRSLLAVGTTHKNVPLEILFTALEDDRIVFVLFPVDDKPVIIRIAVIGCFFGLYVIFP